MNLEHKIKILIEGKNLLGKELEDAVNDLNVTGSEVLKLYAKLRKLEEAARLKNATAGIERFKKVVTSLGKVFGDVIKKLLGLVQKLIIGVGALIVVFLGSGAAAAKYAANLESVERTFRAIHGDAAPKMLQALRDSSAYMLSDLALQKQYNQSYMLTGKLLADRLPEAYEYMAKVALATNEDVDFLVERLYRSVGRLSTRWMSYVGTVVTLEEAQLHATEMLGKTADELTRTEIQAAMLDRVLEKLNARTGEMPALLGTSAQMFKALQVSVQNLWGAYGKHFLPISREVTRGLLNVSRAATDVISEGGALYDVFRIWSAAGTVLAEAFGDLVSKFLKADSALFKHLKNFGERLTSFAWKAFQWGANISVQLAAGLIKGASVAITAAMNFISGMLAWWLRGHSPPRIAPELVEWGAAAMEEWLKGFTLASFDTLEQVQGKLESVLGAFVGMEWITKSGAAKTFLEITKQMSEGLSRLDTVGGVLGETFKKLAEVGGGFGEHLVKYAKLQLSVTKATEKLAKAIRDLKVANIELEDSQEHLSKTSEEYQMMLIRGASYYELKAKREEVRAAKERKLKAEEAIKAAEKEKSVAEKQLEIDKERLALQGRLLDQLVLLLQKQAELREDATGRGGAGRGGAGRVGAGPGGAGGLPDMLEPIIPELMSGVELDQAFEDLKDRIRGKFEDLWAELSGVWKSSGAVQAFAGLQVAFGRLKDSLDTSVGPIITSLREFVEPFYEWFSNDIFGWTLGELGKWKDWWEDEAPKLVAAVETLTESLGPEVDSLIDIVFAYAITYLETKTNQLKLAIEISSSMLRTAIEVAAALIEGDVPAALESLGEGVAESLVTVLKPSLSSKDMKRIRGTWLPKIKALGGVVTTVFGNSLEPARGVYTDEFLGEVSKDTDHFKVNWSNVWGEITGILQSSVSSELTPALETLSTKLGLGLPNSLKTLKKAFEIDTIPAVETSLTNMESTTGKVCRSMVQGAETDVPTALGTLSTKFKDALSKIDLAIQPVKTLWDKFVEAIKGFSSWLSTKVFKFSFDWPILPSWAQLDSPLKIHTAWKNFHKDLQHMTFAPNLQLGEGLQPAYAMAGAGQSGGSQQHVYIERLVLENVQDAPDLLRQLQEISL